MKIKTSELTGPALDWAVAKCWYGDEYDMSIPLFEDGKLFAPSTDWAQGGPIVEREGIAVWPDEEGGWFASANEGKGNDFHGPTLFIAAMRCYVASKLGDEVEIPEALKTAQEAV